MSPRMTITLAGVLAIAVISASRLWKASNQDLKVDSAQLNLGQVWLTEKLLHKLTIRNALRREIKILGFDTSCACTAVTPGTIVLAAKDTVPVEVRIDAPQIVRGNLGANHWPIDVAIKAITNDRNISGRWRLRGSIRSPFQVLPRASPDALVLWRTDPPHSVSFDIRLRESVTLEKVQATSLGVSCTLRAKESTGAIVEMEIDPSQLEPGRRIARGALQMHDDQGTALPPFPLEVPVTVKPSVVAEPSVVLLLDSTSSRKVVLKAEGDRRFKIIAISSEEGIATRLVETRGEYADSRMIEIVPITEDSTMSLHSVHVDVTTENSQVRERLTLLIQYPTNDLANRVAE